MQKDLVSELLENKSLKFSGTKDTGSFKESKIVVCEDWKDANFKFKMFIEFLKVDERVDLNGLALDYSSNAVYVR